MKNGKCPKCGSIHVFTKPSALEGAQIEGRRYDHQDYLCIDCGYHESYFMIEPEKLRKMMEVYNWKKVS